MIPYLLGMHDIGFLLFFDREFEYFQCSVLKFLGTSYKLASASFSGDFTFMSDTILSTLASKQTLVGSDYSDPKVSEKTVKQEDSCTIEYTCEDDEETDDSSTEANPSSRLHEFGLTPLASSPCYAEAGAAGDDGEHLFL